MKVDKRDAVLCIFVMAAVVASLHSQGRPNLADINQARNANLPPKATRCDPSLPIFVELTPTVEPVIGRAVRLEVKIESALDPDLVERSWVEWEIPSGIRRLSTPERGMSIVNRSGRGRTSLDVVIPDGSRYELRARLVVQLKSGQTVAQTAVRWIRLGREDLPEGMIGRVVGPDGSGVRVYQGTTVRK